MTESATSLCERLHQWLDEIFTFYNRSENAAVEPIWWRRERRAAKLPPRKDSDEERGGRRGRRGDGVAKVHEGFKKGLDGLLMAAGMDTAEGEEDRDYIIIPIGRRSGGGEERLIEKKYLDGYSNGAGKRRRGADLV